MESEHDDFCWESTLVASKEAMEEEPTRRELTLLPRVPQIGGDRRQAIRQGSGGTRLPVVVQAVQWLLLLGGLWVDGVVVRVLVEERGSVVGGQDATRANQWMVQRMGSAQKRAKIGGIGGGGKAEDLRICMADTRAVNFQVPGGVRFAPGREERMDGRNRVAV